MTRIRLLLAVAGAALTAQGQQASTTLASLVDSQINAIEQRVVEAAEAMPENQYDFSPERLHISGASYQDVRTFAQEVKHIAASNYALWSAVTGDSFPKDFYGGNGPEGVKTKAEIMQFLKDSFALGHKAAAGLTPQNMLQNPEKSKTARLDRTVFAIEHAYDHYGQLVEYLRMNGIVPPASR